MQNLLSSRASKATEAVMLCARILLLAVLTTGIGFGQQKPNMDPARPMRSYPPSCPVTQRQAKPFVPPSPYPFQLPENSFWLGSEKLWTNLREPLIWRAQSGSDRLTAKVFWYRVGYDWRSEPIPKLKVTGKRLDSPAAPLVFPPTNAILGSHPYNAAMLTGVTIPSPGCWQISADYEGDTLAFVVWVTPER
jgi:hypothetical protein